MEFGENDENLAWLKIPSRDAYSCIMYILLNSVSGT